jgi:hypothetical protein
MLGPVRRNKHCDDAGKVKGRVEVSHTPLLPVLPLEPHVSTGLTPEFAKVKDGVVGVNTAKEYPCYNAG